MTTTSNNVDVFAETVSGGGGTPASTVVTETSFGQASAVGTSTLYARADHTHGTPPAPDIYNPLQRSGYIQADAGNLGGQGISSGLSNVQYLPGTGPEGYASNKYFDSCSYSGGQFFVTYESLPVFKTCILTQQAAAAATTYVGLGYGGFPLSAGGWPLALFVFDQSLYAGQTNWNFRIDDGSTINTIDTGVAYANNTVYTMEISIPTSTTVIAKINGTVVATATHAIPASTDILFGITDAASIAYNKIYIQEGA